MSAPASQATSDIAATLMALVAQDGTLSSRHAALLSRPGAPRRDLSDAIHSLCVIHGAFPGVVDHAMRSVTDLPARAWLQRATSEAAEERALLARLTASVGPLPSTPGQAASEAAVLNQRHALEMLARSDRTGCALGTALAFALDWEHVRAVLDACAERTGIGAAPPYRGVAEAARAFLRSLSPPATPGVARAMNFGAQQMLAQHRGLWQLLESRAAARAALDRN